MTAARDWTGQAFGHARVLRRVNTAPSGAAMWSIRCGCGREFVRASGVLTNARAAGRALNCNTCIADVRSVGGRARMARGQGPYAAGRRSS